MGSSNYRIGPGQPLAFLVFLFNLMLIVAARLCRAPRMA